MQKSGMHIFDPKKLILDPFDACPQCHAVEFGVLGVYGRTYVKRCRNCMYDQTFSLPALKKKIIYLDQFVFSGMYKSLVGRNSSDKNQPFYHSLFSKLDRLSKMQVIVCPHSDIHFCESYVTPYFKAENRLYKHLAHGTQCDLPSAVKLAQIKQLFQQLRSYDLTDDGAIEAIHGETNSWHGRLLIYTTMPDLAEIREDIDQSRDLVASELGILFAKWQDEQGFNFDAMYSHEVSSYGPALWQNYKNEVVQQYQAFQSGDFSNLVGLSFVRNCILMLKDCLDDEAYSGNIFQVIYDFLMSEDIKHFPFLAISSLMYASLAQKAAEGQKKLPSRGMMNDINAIATYIPYCDAMFVDNECRNLITSKAPKSRIKESIKAEYSLNEKLYSLSNKEQFLKYLDGLEQGVSEKHLAIIKKVYGEGWLQPFIAMYQVTE